MHWPGNSQLTICRQTHTHTRLTAFFSGTTHVSRYQKGKNQSGFYWSKRQWVAVASAGPYASLHLAPDRQPHQHPITLFLQAGCPSCRPTNSIKALKASKPYWYATNHWGELNLAISQWIGAMYEQQQVQTQQFTSKWPRTFTVDTGQRKWCPFHQKSYNSKPTF